MTNESTGPQIYVTDRESKQYVAVLHENALYLLEDVSKKVAQTAIKSISDGGPVVDALGDKAIIIPVDSVTKMTTAQHDDFVKVWYSKDGAEKKHVVAMESHDEQIALMRSMASAIPSAKESEEPIPVIQAIIGPGLTSLGIIGGTILFFVLANDVASGNEIDTSGRRGGLKLIIAKVLGALGPTGVIAIGVLALAGSLYWVYKRVQSPPIRTTIECSA
ncbi:hypothetical protein [Gimesia aquarii]|uniref:Uncharacterized protein n=1 Tax=Gimesia aquarii TaxID=2527964 RepID=A0A517X2Y2_9PLAN|nr:hypothetical protein [Gimesia aquarii]QDU11860.1 hypothetical protein V202x_52850 [Gimesia aquarii]